MSHFDDQVLLGLCPHCGGNGCEQCNAGKIELTFPADDWYTLHCTNPSCGFDNGGCQGKSIRDEDYPCVMCDSQEHDVIWIPMCESVDDAPWKINFRDKPFAQYLLRLETMVIDELEPPADTA